MGETKAAAVRLPGGEVLDADLGLVPDATGVVVFAHGSGSGRSSPRNRSVAHAFHDRRLDTVLVDLLTSAEQTIDERTRHLRFDVGLLAGRLVATVDWLREQPWAAELPVGYFGASTGAAAALIAAAQQPEGIGAVVSRGGRADLAGSLLTAVRCPTLLIVGGNDPVVLELNQRALSKLRVEASLEVVAGATHLFEEPGTMDRVADLAGRWFEEHLVSPSGRSVP